MSMRIDESEYRIARFIDVGYYRKKCKSCGNYFWTRVKDQEYCNDIPCTDYSFFDIKLKTNGLSVKEVREKFLTFFEKRGHKRLRPRPVIARWRDDLYLTIASIVVFQPHITSGLVPPPANPLTISQPSIRLDDIDNVGVTFGRHLTMFEMAAHHAFNSKEKKIYWKDETVNYAIDFFRDEIGVDEDLLTFKESWWEGGGDAGPCLEVTIGGLEVATLVFMQYKKSDSKYYELPLKIVDTGYGVERIAWLTQKSETAFNAIFGELTKKFFSLLDVSYPGKSLLYTASRLAGRIDPDNPFTIKKHIEEVAKVSGLQYEEVKEGLEKASRVFQVLDHTRTITMMLADGLVPSNSGEGYLGRLVIRRALRAMSHFKADITLKELIELQINYWSNDFPQMWVNKDYILDAVEEEEKKYLNLIRRADSIISSLTSKGDISINKLIELYDSNGITPDMLIARGIKVDVPHNFFSLIAKKGSSLVKREKKEELSLHQISLNYPKTFPLYYEDSYIRSFEAKVIGAYKNIVILDKTAMYPEGGGQLSDLGFLEIGGGKYKVINVQKVNGVIFHFINEEVEGKVKIGDHVKGEIDWYRRYNLMRHHTSTHVLLATIRRVLGNHIWQAGAEKTPEKGRLDVTHYKMPSNEEIERIEKIANEVVLDRRNIRTYKMIRTEAEEKFGFTIYEGGVPEEREIRLMEIENWDIEACGGTHLHNTGEIGGIKIINVEKIQDGVVRFEFVAGTRITEYAKEIREKITKLSQILASPEEEIEKRAERILHEMKKYNEISKYYRRNYITLSLSKFIDRGDYKIYYIKSEIDDEELARDFFKEGNRKDEKGLFIILRKLTEGVRMDIALGSKLKGLLKAKEIIDKIARGLEYKGGGKDDYASIIIKGVTLSEAEKLVEKI